jgi:ribosomal protein S18 acetylase RimI-like enzyme
MDQYVLTEGFDEAERSDVVALLREYEAGIGISLCFQDFEAEVAGLPGAYAPPNGTMIFARRARDSSLAGCVAVRAVATAGVCEMKRLYVRASARKGGLGRQLACAAIDAGRRLGYERISLDTLPSMVAAQDLYRSLTFREVGQSESEPRVILFERDL